MDLNMKDKDFIGPEGKIFRFSEARPKNCNDVQSGFLNYAAKMNECKSSESQVAEAHKEILNSLKDAVNGMIDNTYGKQAAAGIKQILEKKKDYS
ncbi:19488_t:CDS:2, partial [Funneliformis geosporum]